MRDVAIIGAGTTRFGRAQWSLMKLLSEAAHSAITDAGLKDRKAIDAVYVANMGAGKNNRQVGIASALVDRLNLFPAPADTIENGPASGASAVKTGFLAVASGMYDCVLVVGGERMREVNNFEATEFVSFLSTVSRNILMASRFPGLPACSRGCTWRNMASRASTLRWWR